MKYFVHKFSKDRVFLESVYLHVYPIVMMLKYIMCYGI